MPSSPRRIYHYHVRKTAGTSLDSSFWALGGTEMETAARGEAVRGAKVAPNGMRFVKHDPKEIAGGDYFYASSHEPAYHLDVPADAFTITILRDPAARVVSYYRYLLWARSHPEARDVEPFIDEIRAESTFMDGGLAYLRSQSSGLRPATVARALRRFRPRPFLARLRPSRPGAEGDTTDFLEFLDRVPARRLLTQVHMFSEAMDPGEAAAKVLSCDAVCFTETFSDDLARLSEELDLDLRERRERGFGAKVELSDRERKILRERMAPEYEMIEKVRAGLSLSAPS